MKTYVLNADRTQSLNSFMQENEGNFDSGPEKISNSKLRRLIISGSVSVNGKICRLPSFTLHPGARVEVRIDSEKLLYEKKPDDIHFEMSGDDVLFEDEWLIAVNKPAFLPAEKTVVPGRSNMHQCVIDFLFKRNGQLRNPPYVGMMHRLDRETSGVMLFTKKREINAAMHALFEEHGIQKTYRAVAFNMNKKEIPERFFIEGYMSRTSSKSSACRMGISQNAGAGLFSHTDFRTVKIQGSRVHLECMPKTGRTHQIRVHAAEAGLPLFGDVLYGGPEGFSENGGRIMLHSQSLEFIHPLTGNEVKITSPLPQLF